jgi:hypothetical protein
MFLLTGKSFLSQRKKRRKKEEGKSGFDADIFFFGSVGSVSALACDWLGLRGGELSAHGLVIYPASQSQISCVSSPTESITMKLIIMSSCMQRITVDSVTGMETCWWYSCQAHLINTIPS